MSTLSPASVVLSLLLREQREAQAVFDSALARLNDVSRAIDWFRVAEDSIGPMGAQDATKAAWRLKACADTVGAVGRPPKHAGGAARKCA